MRDSLCVRLGEADGDVGREPEALHRASLRLPRGARRSARQARPHAAPCVVLTGAGVSTESGIPDFRSPYGDLGRRRPVRVRVDRRVPPRSGRSGTSTARASRRCSQPSRTRRTVALAELERRGCVQAVITQNIDRCTSGPGASTSSRCTVRSAVGLPPLPRVELLRRRARAARGSAGAALPGLRRDPEARRRPLRRARCRHRDRPCDDARPRSRAPARRRLLARGLAGGRSAARGAPPSRS